MALSTQSSYVDVDLNDKVTKEFDALYDEVTKEIDAGNVYADVDEVMTEIRQFIDKGVSSDQIKAAIEKHSMGIKNRCFECGVDMGICNPRQLCNKTYCGGDPFDILRTMD